jgi:hypothetical protein
LLGLVVDCAISEWSDVVVELVLSLVDSNRVVEALDILLEGGTVAKRRILFA